VRELSQLVLEREENHSKLAKKLINYRPQRTDKSDMSCLQELTNDFDQNESINYRGVSRNGNFGWQIMCIVERRQQFIATVENKQMAAVVHDIVQIQNNGLVVKTNFNYSMRDLLALLCMPSLLDVRKIVFK